MKYQCKVRRIAMEELEVNIDEIKAALEELGISISMDELNTMSRDFLIILQAKLFDIKKIKKEMEFLIQNNQILHSLIDTYQQKIKILSDDVKKNKDQEMEM